MTDDKTPTPDPRDRLRAWLVQTAVLVVAAVLGSLLTRWLGTPVVIPPLVVSVETPAGSPPPTITVIHPSPPSPQP